jgi:hypothetical protein
MARPSTYKPEYAVQAKEICMLGATDLEIARFFKVSNFTIWAWSNKYKEFAEAIKVGKTAFDDRVERSLAMRALGFEKEVEEVKITKDGDIVRYKYTKYYAPDTVAGIFWLKNRRSGEWREKTEVQHGGEIQVTDAQARDAIYRRMDSIVARLHAQAGTGGVLEGPQDGGPAGRLEILGPAKTAGSGG